MKTPAVLGSVRQFSTISVVAGISGVYAGFLVTCSAVFAASSTASGTAAVAAILPVVAAVFILIATYVTAVVIVNCIDTVLAGMLHRIALLRLLGGSARSLRSSVARRTTLLATAGAIGGVLVGALAGDVLRIVLVDQGQLTRTADYPWLTWWLVAPVLVSTATTYLAGRIGTGRVLRVAPATAMLGASADPREDHGPAARRRGSWALIGTGALLLVAAMWIGEVGGTALGFLVAFVGAATMSTGLLTGARLVIPAVVAGLGRILGSSPPSLVARRNAVKNPLRTTRSTMGLVVGVTLVTTFACGMDALRRSVDSWETSPAQRQQALSLLSTMTTVLVAVIVVSAVIASVGFVSTMSLTVIERGHEIGLLRALGFTRSQVRRMIVLESAALACSAAGLGIALGLFFGSAGAQSLVGFQTPGFVWGLPALVLAAVASGAVVLVLVASTGPARRAVDVTPVEALRT
ncbi:FtsX-like permease family protein [Marmoricola sp. URHB0036]|uniref:ABC transporter permease n=1 Tax=Marmoricola sp. URHB0036 TaxID=1298863 RepID=UPI0003FD8609|nr:FtsX-like permease family protein [Marmoricola sp. URHB0036]